MLNVANQIAKHRLNAGVLRSGRCRRWLTDAAVKSKRTLIVS
jgi:hypothetical protein